MIRQLLAHALLVGFWLPPLVAGLWMAGRRQRVLSIPLAVVAWSLIGSCLCICCPRHTFPKGQTIST
jgi:hypothetical protein